MRAARLSVRLPFVRQPGVPPDRSVAPLACSDGFLRVLRGFSFLTVSGCWFFPLLVDFLSFKILCECCIVDFFTAVREKCGFFDSQIVCLFVLLFLAS